jgi:hypothetical protein
MDDFRKFLIDLLEKPELANNKLAWTVANYPNLNTNSKENFYESVRSFYPFHATNLATIQPQSVDNETTDDDSYKNKDFRIKQIKLSGVRCFPESNDKPYGVNFCKEGNEHPSSAIILGSNGIGKSSIFDALEFMFCGRIGEYELRNDKASISSDYSDTFKDYLTHLNSNSKQANCIIETMDSEISFPNELLTESIRKKIIPNSFFISEYDLYTIGKLDFEISEEKSFHYFIASSLGLKSYLDFLKIINLLVNYNRIKESRNLNTLNKEIETLIANIKSWEEEIERRIKAEEKISSDSPKKNTSDNAIEEQLKFIQALSYKDFTSHDVEQVKKYYLNFISSYKELKEVAIEKKEEETLEFLELGLNILKHADDCPLCDNSSKTVPEIINHVNSKIHTVKLYAERRKILSDAYYDYNLSIFNFFQNLTAVKSNSEQENNSQLVKIPEALPLIEINNRFIALANSNLEYYIKLYSLPNNFSLSEAEILFNNLTDNQFFFNNSLADFTSESDNLLGERKEIIEKSIEIINKKVSIPINDNARQLAMIDQEIIQFKNQKSNAENRLREAQIEQSEAQINLIIYQSIKYDSIIYRDIVKTEIDKKISEVFNPIKDIVEDLLNEFNINDGFKILVGKGQVFDSETDDLISEYIKVYASKDEHEYDIKKYLNTFRYKVFSLILSFSVAIANRKQNKLSINIPFVIDDIFHSSDFEKRLLVEEFISKFFDLYSKYCSEMPIQLILFTHDELIFDCILNKLIQKGLADNTIFARLISHNDSEDKEDYKELLYKIPDEIPGLINKNIIELLNN